MKNAALIMVGTAIVMTLAGCGPSYVRKGDEELSLKGMRIGVIAKDYQVIDPAGGIIHGAPIKSASRPVGLVLDSEYRDTLKNMGFQAGLVKETPEMTALLDRYSAIPVSRTYFHDIGDSTNLGDVHRLFQDSGIDLLVIIGGMSTVPRSAVANLTEAAVRTAGALALGTFFGGGVQPMTGMGLSVLTANGTFLYDDHRSFSKKANLLDGYDRTYMEKTMVEYLSGAFGK